MDTTLEIAAAQAAWLIVAAGAPVVREINATGGDDLSAGLRNQKPGCRMSELFRDIRQLAPIGA